MSVDRLKVYESASDFFDLDGGVVMKLTWSAALDVCRDAAEHGLLVVRIEGGIDREGTFEARLDAIWDGADPPIDHRTAQANNVRAADFIRAQNDEYNAFIITDALLTGWRQHRGFFTTPAQTDR
jgi:hypothetical protein